MTDGQENASRELTHAQVKALIERQTPDYAWQFLYMGADQDAIEVGASIGVAATNSMTYGRGRVAAAMAATSRNIGLHPLGRRRGRLRQGGGRPPRLRRRAASSRHRVTRRGAITRRHAKP